MNKKQKLISIIDELEKTLYKRLSKDIKGTIQYIEKIKTDYPDIGDAYAYRIEKLYINAWIAKIDFENLQNDLYNSAYEDYYKLCSLIGKEIPQIEKIIKSKLSKYIHYIENKLKECNNEKKIQILLNLERNIPKYEYESLYKKIFTDERFVSEYKIEKLLKECEFNKVCEFVDSSICIDDYIIKNKKKIINEIKKYIYDLLDSISFSKADDKISKIIESLPETFKTELKNFYFSQNVRQYACVKEKLLKLLKKYNFKNAEKLYKESINVIDEEEYIEWVNEQLENYFDEFADITNGMSVNDLYQNLLTIKNISVNNSLESRYISILQQYTHNIFSAEKILSKEKFNEVIPENCKWLKIKYEYFYNILNFLKLYDFYNADNLYAEYKKSFSEQDNYKKNKSIFIKKYFQEKHNIEINDEQAQTIANTAQNVLVTARAGSGKTRTIACRTIYAIEKENIKPDEIMLLSFNKNAANEMNERIRDNFAYKKFDTKCARTFHSFAYNIVNPHEELIYDDGDKDVKQKLTRFFQKIYLSKEILTEEFKNNLYEYYRWTPSNLDEIEKYWGFTNDETKYQYLRHKKMVTLNREKVKSNGEKWIADFLFEHGIKYSYEKMLTCGKKGYEYLLYRPDFTIWNEKTKTEFIIEHWGIDENDPNRSVPKHWNKSWDDYYEEMQWKRQTIKINSQKYKKRIKLIETSISDLSYGRKEFENYFKGLLESNGIKCNKLSQEEILCKIDKNCVDNMAKKFAQFILYAQKVKYSPDYIDEKLRANIYNGNLRCESFVKMANTIYKKYQYELKKQEKTDFDNILIRATDKILNTNGNCKITLNEHNPQSIKNLKMLLIDEFQDFSQLFFDMIDAIIKINPKIKIFCVGDDWQAINAFAGSDLKFFKNFCKYFPNSDRENLTCNYRSCSNIVEAGNLLMKNEGIPAEYINNSRGNIWLCNIDDVKIYNNNAQIDREFIYDYKFDNRIDNRKPFFEPHHRYLKKCIEIISKKPYESYFIMHREQKLCHYKEIQEFSRKIKFYFEKLNINVDIKTETIHKFKGMEADNVIILEATNDKIPLIHPDSEFDLIFGKTPQMVLDEERRLFYVAITRAKQNVYILTEREKHSEYVDIISPEPYRSWVLRYAKPLRWDANGRLPYIFLETS